MTSFDFVRNERPAFVTTILELRIAPRLHTACAALIGALLFVGCAWALQAHRLQAALAEQSVVQREYDATRRSLATAHVYYARVAQLVAVDAQVRDIAASGDYQARELTEIANGIPARAWLTSISSDGSGLVLDGNSTDLDTLGRAFRAFAVSKTVVSPVLVRTDAQEAPGRGPGVVKYTLRLSSSST